MAPADTLRGTSTTTAMTTATGTTITSSTTTGTTITDTTTRPSTEAAPPLSPAALIELIRLASPALPVGGFSYSEGLEAAVDAGLLADEAAVERWLIDQLHLGLARSDLPAAAQAFVAWRAGDFTRVSALNAWVAQTRESRELLAQSQQMGRSLLEWLRRRGGNASADADLLVAAALQPAPMWPLVFALAAARCGAPLRESMLAFTAGWCDNLVAAAIKAVPLGQVAGQRLLDALAAQTPGVVDAALQLSDGARQVFAPMLAVLSARHEVQYSRLFRS
jgi:urease accessory protein